MSTRMTLGKTLIVVLVCILACGFIMWAFGGLNDMSVDNAKRVYIVLCNRARKYIIVTLIVAQNEAQMKIKIK